MATYSNGLFSLYLKPTYVYFADECKWVTGSEAWLASGMNNFRI